MNFDPDWKFVFSVVFRSTVWGLVPMMMIDRILDLMRSGKINNPSDLMSLYVGMVLGIAVLFIITDIASQFAGLTLPDG